MTDMITKTKTEVATMSMTTGFYSSEQARDFLNSTLKCEVGFHNVQNFISQVRTEDDCLQAQANLSRLSAVADGVEQLLAKASNENRSLRIKSVLVLSLEE